MTAKGSKEDRKQPAGKKPAAKVNKDLLLRMHDLMVKARETEERQIKMYKKGDGFFWIGGPGEEAIAVPLGMLVKRGQGVEYDYLHLHYRCCPTVIAMGGEPIDTFRQMKNTATDPYSGGRNFSNHFSIRKWNVVPVTSTIETQFQTAIGTGIAQAQRGGDGITIVTGGDAGTAEAEFASCLVWAARPMLQLPILMICTNNYYGISTDAHTQQKDGIIARRAEAFGIKNARINGNDPVESYEALSSAMEYVRTERKPFLIEAKVSRLYGHSSATGCNYVSEETDCLTDFEKKLVKEKLLTQKKVDEIRQRYHDEMAAAAEQVIKEPQPDPGSIYDHVYHGQKGKYW